MPYLQVTTLSPASDSAYTQGLPCKTDMKGMPMDAVSVTIRRVVDDSFPGFVECVLVDADGHGHRFVDKAPVLGGPSDLSVDNVFPQPGHIACVVQEEWTDESERKRVRVDTVEPWGIASTAGETCFTVFHDQLIRS